jgi:Tfp pilus assembly protein PilO
MKEMLKTKPYLLIIILIVGFIVFKGIKSIVKDSKDYITETTLEEKGLKLKEEQRIIIVSIDSINKIIEQDKIELEKIDYQKIKQLRHDYPIKRIAENYKGNSNNDCTDCTYANDSLITKWK